jgi:hypothetical protein
MFVDGFLKPNEYLAFVFDAGVPLSKSPRIAICYLPWRASTCEIFSLFLQKFHFDFESAKAGIVH